MKSWKISYIIFNRLLYLHGRYFLAVNDRKYSHLSTYNYETATIIYSAYSHTEILPLPLYNYEMHDYVTSNNMYTYTTHMMI